MLGNTFFLWRLVLAHLLADYVLQTNKIAKWKAESPAGIAAHSCIFLIFAVIFSIVKFAPFEINFASLGSVWHVLLFLTAAHFMIDQGRVTAVKKFGWPDNFEFFILDQCLHLALIVAANAIVKFTSNNANFPPIPETWTVIFSLYIFATYFTTIFIYYLEKQDRKMAVLTGPEKYFGISERLLICVLFTVPGKIVFLLPVIFLGRLYIYLTNRNKLIFDFLNVCLGNVIAISLGVLIRFVIIK